MALFGNEEGDVGPFVMTEDGEEWFPFTLDNLEMDRGCTPLDQVSKPMQQDDGETDQDDDADGGSREGDSGPGPPDRRLDGSDDNNGSSNARPRWVGGSSGSSGGGGGRKSGGNAGVAAPKHQGPGTKSVSVPPAKAASLVKPEAQEVQSKKELKTLVTEDALAKLSSRGRRRDQKSKHRAPAGGMAGGVGGMTSRSEAAPWSGKDDREGKTTKSISSDGTTPKGPSVQNRRRLERNAREQRRSLKISQRIEELRLMLSQFGVNVKTSKSAVLSEAADYIAHLKRQHAQSEAERAKVLLLLQNAQRGAGADVKPSTAAAAAAAAAAVVSGSTAGGAAGTAASAGGPASSVPTAAAGSSAAAAAAAAPAPTPTTQPGRTVKSPPSGAQQRTIPLGVAAAGAAVSGGTRPTAARFAAIEGTGVCGVEPVSESWMIDESTAAAAAAGVAPQQAGVPGFPGLSVAARGGGQGFVPMQILPPGGLMPASVASVATAAPVAVAGGIGGGVADFDATAQAMSHVYYDRVFRTVPVPMAIANVNGNLVDCNAKFTEVTGFRKEDMLFTTIFDLVTSEYAQHTFSMISVILSVGGVANPPFFQVLGKHRDGSPGGMLRISVVQDEALRQLHFCVCVMDGGGAGVAAAGPGGGVGGIGGVGMMMAAGAGGVVGAGNGGVVRTRANASGP